MSLKIINTELCVFQHDFVSMLQVCVILWMKSEGAKPLPPLFSALLSFALNFHHHRLPSAISTSECDLRLHQYLRLQHPVRIVYLLLHHRRHHEGNPAPHQLLRCIPRKIFASVE